MQAILISGVSGLTAVDFVGCNAIDQSCFNDSHEDVCHSVDEIRKIYILKTHDDYESCKILVPKSDYEWWNPPVIGRPIKPVFLPKITIRNSLPRKIRAD